MKNLNSSQCHKRRSFLCPSSIINLFIKKYSKSKIRAIFRDVSFSLIVFFFSAKKFIVFEARWSRTADKQLVVTKIKVKKKRRELSQNEKRELERCEYGFDYVRYLLLKLNGVLT